MIPPTSFFPTLLTFHIFPLHAPITLWHLDAPFGRFSSKTSNLNVNGNIAWAAAELVSPITFATTLLVNPHPPLNYPSRILAGLYFAHYAHRAIVSPLILSPKRSPLHVVVALAMGLFNLFNGYLVAAGLAFYPPEAEISWKFWIGVAGWAIGFLGNVYHDEVLNDLRRLPGDRLVTSRLSEDEDPKAGRYKIPRGGLYKFVSFPNYFSEWIEWTFYALAATSPSVSNSLVPLPPLAHLRLHAGLRGSLVKLIAKIWWPPYLLHPAWMFVLAEVACMLPRALRGHQWNQEKLKGYPKDRKAVIPGLL
ncbi:uncharacterized protein I303_104677 [Kwoniella dejecticola CBS 10117]|uniref:3-oxo-5-alpha-steroid 4-dehydrogenase 1 n=1 Tax=Kwoniella dejecticola CBS 10117 TaxID=1296121 RepID=A0A1A6A4M4_9TREE|nr:3-oxo-5-alpha-steroid 4-dehydrogenase 1 [Kwoniella dejecticola CBS 10117]OBR85015.1 3-oxo-5-alpha-steroid 4-dehydrogenase 1 [Kwoniella dejecticola CBS 10117]